LSTLPQRGIPLGRRSGVRRTVPWPLQAAFSGQSRARGYCKVARFARSGPLLFGLMQAEADSILGARRRKGGGAESVRIDGRNALHGRRTQAHVAGSLHRLPFLRGQPEHGRPKPRIAGAAPYARLEIEPPIVDGRSGVT